MRGVFIELRILAYVGLRIFLYVGPAKGSEGVEELLLILDAHNG